MQDDIGSRLRSVRERLGMKQADLSQLVNISTVSLSRYENNLTSPGVEELRKIAAALGTSAGYLLGETDDPRVPDYVLENARIDAAKSSGRIISVPVYGKDAAACCGNGFCLDGVTAEPVEFLDIPAGFIGPIDRERPPFIIYAEGDSMVDADIVDGAQVIINPADPVGDGDAALVDFAMTPVSHSIAVKRVYWLDGGAIEIRSACGDGWKRTFTAADAEEKSIRVIGKVEWVGHKPRKG